MAWLRRFRCRPVFWRVLVMCLMGLTAASLLLSTLVLLPEGPDNVHFLERTICTVKNISYLEQFCPRYTSNDVFIMNYKEDWKPCLVPVLQLEIEPGKIQNITNCSWRHPQSYETVIEATIELGGKYHLGTQYKCVIDKIHGICYPDKEEITIFIVVVSGLSVLFVILTGICCYQQKLLKDHSKKSGEKKKS